MRGAKRVNLGCFTLQARRREANETASPASRFGLTVTRKSGNAVQRNRIRRRLRDAVRQIAGKHAAPGHDYVIIAKADALTKSFCELTRELTHGLGAIGQQRGTYKSSPPKTNRRQAADSLKTRAGKLT